MASILGFFSVSPAYAGMIPTAASLSDSQNREPRIRGNDPTAGRRSSTARREPRIRGNDP